jgi:1-acyl-sn-glycerol-3-phosphate acyltransferase
MFAVAGTELIVKRPATREARADWLHRFAAGAMRRLEIEIEVEGRFPERGALISNHLSYLDIVVFAALHRCVFVAMAEIESWPVLGWMTTMSGTVYVARGHGGSAARARKGMRAALDAGLPVVFFPEGKTSDGSGLLRFHSGLLGQVMEDGAKVTAAYLRYEIGAENGPEVTVAHDVCWGDKRLVAHIFTLLGLRGLRAKVRFAEEPVRFSSATLHRKRAAAEAQAAVAELKLESDGMYARAR